MIGTNTDLTANPYVASAWGDVIWDITNGQCLNCSSTNMTPTQNLYLTTQGTLMLVQPKDVSQDCIIKWAVRPPGGESRVVAPVNNAPGGQELRPTAWDAIYTAMDQKLAEAWVYALENPDVVQKYFNWLMAPAGTSGF
jgi:hypothetical protein